MICIQSFALAFKVELELVKLWIKFGVETKLLCQKLPLKSRLQDLYEIIAVSFVTLTTRMIFNHRLRTFAFQKLQFWFGFQQIFEPRHVLALPVAELKSGRSWIGTWSENATRQSDAAIEQMLIWPVATPNDFEHNLLPDSIDAWSTLGDAPVNFEPAAALDSCTRRGCKLAPVLGPTRNPFSGWSASTHATRNNKTLNRTRCGPILELRNYSNQLTLVHSELTIGSQLGVVSLTCGSTNPGIKATDWLAVTSSVCRELFEWVDSIRRGWTVRSLSPVVPTVEVAEMSAQSKWTTG